MQELKNYPAYLISEDGRVLNKQYMRELKGYSSLTTGYIYITLRKGGQTFKHPLHRLLALQFIPNPEGKPMVNHRDGCKLNNSLYNLEWVTNQENVQHAYDIGVNQKMADRWNNKNPVEKIFQTCELLEEGLLNMKEISELTGVSHATVKEIKYRKNWKDISKLFVW